MDEAKERERELDAEIEALAKGSPSSGAGIPGGPAGKAAVVVAGVAVLYGVWHFALGGEARCNDAKVETYDAWATLRGDLETACSAYRSEEVTSVRQRANDSLRANRPGGYGFNYAAAGFVLEWGEQYEAIEGACSAIERARDAARGGAVPSREASSAALTALRTAVAKHGEPRTSRGGGGADDAASAAYEKVRSEFARLRIDQRLEDVTTATTDRWEACRSVQP